jgi:CubicO group peptidase (beta-lactamase class C family)
MNRGSLMVVTLLTFAHSTASSGELPRAEPREVQLSAEKLEELKPALQKLVDGGKIPGGVVLVARHGKIAYLTSFGYRDLATKTPMTEDTIFAIASMTKPIACTAVMMLLEQGKLGLDDSVDKYLPELKNLRVLGAAKDDTETDVATIPAKRSITVRDLLSHTSGFTYGDIPTNDRRLSLSYERAGVDSKELKTVAEQVTRLAKVPLAHQPGEGWTYGLSHDVLGRVIEIVSGQSLDQFLHERIFTPLDMVDTAFFVPAAKRDRVATIYRAVGGTLTARPKRFGSETFFSGGGGLFSTTRDYSRFAQMLQNGGELDGHRIVKPETIAMMTTNQIGKLTALMGKYGLGFGLAMSGRTQDGKPVLARYFWGGYYSTNFWIDPRHDVVAVIMTQVLPTNYGDSNGVFRGKVDAAIQK